MRKQIKENLVYRLLYGQLFQDDISLARAWIIEDYDFVPIWVRVIAGTDSARLDSVQEMAREELAHEILEELEIQGKGKNG